MSLHVKTNIKISLKEVQQKLLADEVRQFFAMEKGRLVCIPCDWCSLIIFFFNF